MLWRRYFGNRSVSYFNPVLQNDDWGLSLTQVSALVALLHSAILAPANSSLLELKILNLEVSRASAYFSDS